MASGLAPVAATLRYASASASCAPVYGSSFAKRPLPSVAMATPRLDSSSMRTMPASSGCESTVLPCTKRSYWSVTQDFEAWFGEETSARTCARSSSEVCGRGSLPASSAWSASCQEGRA